MEKNGSSNSVLTKPTDTECGEAKSCPFSSATHFVKDYIERHAHPANAALHIVGVPAAFAGFFYLLTGKDIPRGLALVVVGYLFQYLGHKAQGNEVGEVTLIKHLIKKAKSRS